MKKHKHGKEKGLVYTLYIYKNEKWTKIGWFCTICGFHISKKALTENLELSDQALSFSFDD